MPNNYSSPQLTFRIFDDELALHVDPWNTAERFSPTPCMTGQKGDALASLAYTFIVSDPENCTDDKTALTGSNPVKHFRFALG